ncbi:MAG: protein kinase domain-containing protein [Steroidobacter sp.]
MNKEAALARLGLAGDEDVATVARVYGDRLSSVQQQLVTAQTDADRMASQTRLSELVEAYEFVTNSGRYTQPPTDDSSATVMRSGEAPAQRANDTFVRMEPGVVLAGRLEIGALLGQGGMGNVYAARDRLKEEDVAIKVLRHDLLFSTAAKERFLAEAKVSCSLSHPNIVRVHDVGLSGDHYYLSMERLKGQTLRHRIEAYHHENREFNVAEVADIARQLIEALRYAHRYIVHRDLKPENIWLAEDGTVKLMDFGIARAFSASQLTQTGMTLGTAYYMAPEQRIAAKEVDWRADQYALGVVLYELLAGTLPTGAVRPLETVRRDLSKRYAAAVMRAMAAKPADRFTSLNELLAEIEAPARKTPVGAMLAIGAGLAAAVAGAFIIMNRQADAPPATPAAATAALDERPADVIEPDALEDAQGAANEIEAVSGTSDGGPPGDPPPASGEPVDAAAITASSDASAGSAPQSKDSGVLAAPPASKPTQRAAIVEIPDSRRQQCIAQCERDEGECRSINRRGKQDCMRAVAFNGSGRLTTTNPSAASCAFFGRDRCIRAVNREACAARIADRYKTCLDVLGGTVVSRRQDCEDNARESEQMCRDELRDCRASCE